MVRELGDGEAGAAMAERLPAGCACCGERRNENETQGALGGVLGASNAELRPDVAWPVRAAPTRGHPRGVELLKLSAL